MSIVAGVFLFVWIASVDWRRRKLLKALEQRVAETERKCEALEFDDIRLREQVKYLEDCRMWTDWRDSGEDTASGPPFGAVRKCRVCGCLVAGGPTACVRCVRAEEAEEQHGDSKEGKR